MAKRGRKPKPPELKIMAGERSDRGNPNAPPRLDGLPEPPAYLDAHGLDAWNRLLPVLDGMGTIGYQDGAALGLLCGAFSRYVRATAKLNASDTDLTVPTRYGLKASPYEAIATRAEATILRILAEFGMTPSARNRVVSTKVNGRSDPLDEFLAG